MEKNINKKIRLGRTNLYVSPVGIGVLPLGPCQLHLPTEDGAKVIAYALKRGINFIDTAQYYRAYPYIKRAFEILKEDSLDPTDLDLVICSKSLGATYEEVESAIDEALTSLGLRTIPIFLLHELRTGDFAVRKAGGAWQALIDAKAKGLVSAIGASTHHIDVTEELAEVEECDVVFSLLNYRGMGIRKGAGTGTPEEMEAAIEKCRSRGKGVFTMKVFGGGNLTGSYQKALDYVFSRESIHSVMVGFSTCGEVDDIFNYLNGSMEETYNPDISNKIIRVSQWDCVGCGTCIKICASNAISYNENGLAQIDQSKCLTCGYCAQGCPVRAIVMY